MNDIAKEKRICVHCGAEVPFGLSNCWLCRKRWDCLEPDAPRKPTPIKPPQSSPAKRPSSIPEKIIIAIVVSFGIVQGMLVMVACVGQALGPRLAPQFLPYFLGFAVAAVFVGACYYVGWNSRAQTAGEVFVRLLRAALLTFVLLIALPLALIIALLLVCFVSINLAGGNGVIR